MASPLTPRATDFPRWYQDVITQAELADNGPVRGTMVIRPWGYAIWERMQAEMDTRIKAAGAENAYFPLFIPESYLRREAEHVEGFSPELAVVTHGGGKELEEPVVVRPTSETVINSFFAKWVQSYRDLPLLINQWANVVRWELRPRLFLRTSEFLWQEGHTAHATEAEAREYALQILHDVYRETMVDVLAVPVQAGLKTARERFAGAIRTWTLRGHDGRRQSPADGHQPRARSELRPGVRHPVLVRDRDAGVCVADVLGGVDPPGRRADHGPRRRRRRCGCRRGWRPFRWSCLLVRDEEGTRRAATAPGRRAGRRPAMRVRLDDRVGTSFGRRSVDWELKGVPVRVEVGPRDLAGGQVTLVRRDLREKRAVPVGRAAELARADLVAVQAALYEAALELQAARTARVATVAEAAGAASEGFAVLPWEAVGLGGEEELAAEGCTVRCLQAGGRVAPR